MYFKKKIIRYNTFIQTMRLLDRQQEGVLNLNVYCSQC